MAVARAIVGIGLIACTSCNTAGVDLVADQGVDRETYLRRVAPDLAITQTAMPEVVATGSNVTFTLRVTNKRPALAPNVVVTDALPPATTFVSCTATGGGTCTGAGNDRRVSFESLPGGVSATIVLVAALNADVANGTVVTNTANVSFEGTDPDVSDNVVAATVRAGNP